MPTYDFEMYAAVHWEGEREVIKGIKSNTQVSTFFTAHLGLQLAMEEINYN